MENLKTKLKVGVVGAAGEARFYIQDYFMPGVAEVAIVQDIDDVRLRTVAEKHGIRWCTTSFQEVLDSDIDIIDISTPNYLHAEQAIAALNAKKHVIVQKPMAPTVQECERIIEAAEKNGRVLGVYMSALNDPLNHEIKRMIHSKLFGTILSMRWRGAHLGGLRMRTNNRLWRSSVEKTGGGAFMQLAIHGIHLLEWFMVGRILRIAAYSKNLMCKDRLEGDDLTTAIGELDSGINVTLEASYSSLGGMLEVYGSEGYLIRHGNEITIYSLNRFDGELISHPGNDTEMRILDSAISEKIKRLEAKYNQHQLFIKSIVGGKRPPVSGEDGLRGVRIVKAAYQASKEARTIEIS